MHNYRALTGTASGLMNQLPWLLVIAAVIGIGFALWLRGRRPADYAAMAESHEDTHPAHVPDTNDTVAREQL